MEQVPLSEAFNLKAGHANSYSIEFARSMCFGDVLAGGILTSAAVKAAIDFVSKNGRFKAHVDALHVTALFFRPSYATPQTTQAIFQMTTSSKKLTVVHFDLCQRETTCAAGYITLTDLSASGATSRDTGWQLSPSPVPCSISDLERDCDPNWIGYLTPFSPHSRRNPHSYIQYHIPVQRKGLLHTIDQWISPGWSEPLSTNAPVWKDEMIHFVVDNCLPLLNDIMHENLYMAVVAAGQTQRKARECGQDNRIMIWGEGLSPRESNFPWIISTISITTEVKMRLPANELRWLFMRATCKCLIDDRMDIEIVVLDPTYRLVAISNQLAQVIPISLKEKKDSRL